MQSINNHITLRTKDLVIGYNNNREETPIAKNLNIDCKKGELIALVGINGSGKSTLLRTLTGLQEPLAGAVYINDKEITKVTPALLAQQLSVVLTNQAISKNLTVAELVALGRQPYTNWLGTLTEVDKDIIITALKRTETYILKDKKCYELSDGQLQRVLIARALAQDTPIIMLDEPMTHLDLHHKASVLNLLARIATEEHKTIIFSTHEIDYAITRCDKMIVMKERQALYDTPEALIAQGVFDVLFPSHNVGFDRKNRIFFLKK
ncbi:ABC transporter ATP-binding protein [uncultured Dokdonia sp.]|uniref:ABC transporter ATP-binding protein n=1 Tax=uncultured Dokdonia sp. TaxID=575653 RepID=UPI002612FC09|nr:ABC transporter ATP-binding protein [uncultured Dokdonia sp.]